MAKQKDLPIRPTDAELEKMWDELGAVTTTPNDLIERSFYTFPRYTHREEIWDWFDERHSKGVVFLMYGETENS
jgi:hypothetical protein